ncbi:MAG: flippase-like domain-containing protein [Candidatus Aenigmarchaeota archaeon]|nr:flippase-like domain-containing protein [Candidatus Aenigmarchaeota archaeon]
MIEKKQKSFYLFWISLALGLIILLILFLTADWRTILSKLLLLTAFEFVIIFSIRFSIFLIGVWQWSRVLRSYHYHVSLADLLISSLAERCVTFFTPILYVGGEGVKAYTIKKIAKVPMKEGLASVIVQRVIEFGTIFLFLLLSGIYLIIQNSPISWLVAVLLGAFILFLLFVILLYAGFINLSIFFKKKKNMGKINKIFTKIIEFKDVVIQFFKTNRGVFLNNSLFALLTIFLYLIQFKLIFYFLGYQVSWTGIIAIYIITTIVGFIPIPGALGTYEGSAILIFSALGLTSSLALTFTLINRATFLIIISFGLLTLFQFTFTRMNQLIFNNHDSLINGETKETN